MTMYKVTNNETGEAFEWTAQQVLDEVNAERSDSWVDYTLEDLAANHDEVVDWAYQYTIEKRRDSMTAMDVYELLNQAGIKFDVVEIFEGSRLIRIEVADEWDDSILEGETA